MIPHRRAAAAFTLLGAALGLYAFACSVGDLDEHGKSCVDTCPSGLPCIAGVCGGAADGSVPSDGATGSDGSATADGGVEAGPPTDCPPGTCAAPAPAGWTGPFQIYDGNPANAPTCPVAAPIVALQANEDMNAPPAAQCSACTCGGAVGATCGKGQIAGSNGCSCAANEFAPATNEFAPATNEFAPATLADAGLWIQPARSKSVIEAASNNAIAIAAKANAALANNAAPRLDASPACLVEKLSIRPRLGAPKSPLIP